MKKIINLTFILIIFPMIVVFAQVKNEIGTQDIESIRKNCDTNSIKYYPNGDISECLLLQNLLLNDFDCKGKITLYSGNKLHQFILNQTVSIFSVVIPSGSTVILDENGFLKECWFSENITIGEIEVKGSSEKVVTTFYNTGRVKSCNLSRNIDIQGVPCSSENMSMVHFYPNGKLKQCTLSRNVNLNDVKYLKGTIIEIGIDGKIKKIND